MRQGISCVLCGAEPGSLDEVRRSPGRLAVGLPQRRPQGGGGGLHWRRSPGRRVARRPLAAGRCCLGGAAGGRRRRPRLVRPGRRTGDLARRFLRLRRPLAMPFDPVELVRRLQTLADLRSADRGAPPPQPRCSPPIATRSASGAWPAAQRAPPAQGGAARQSRRPSGADGRGPTVGERELPRGDVKPALGPGGRRNRPLDRDGAGAAGFHPGHRRDGGKRAADAGGGPCRATLGAGAAAPGRSAEPAGSDATGPQSGSPWLCASWRCAAGCASRRSAKRKACSSIR